MPVQLYAAGIGIRYRGVPPAATNRIQPYSTVLNLSTAPRRAAAAARFILKRIFWLNIRINV